MAIYPEEQVDDLIRLNGILLELNELKDVKITMLQNRIKELETAMIKIKELADIIKDSSTGK